MQTRLTLFYRGVFFACGVVLLAIPNVLLAGVKSTVPVGGQTSVGSALAASQHGVDIHQLLIGSAIALAVLIPVSLGLGWLAASRPLRTITATAQHISATNLHRRLALGDSDNELTQLGDTLDDLFARLEASFQSQRHFVANASHELRTPLAGQRTLVQGARRPPCQRGHSAIGLRGSADLR